MQRYKINGIYVFCAGAAAVNIWVIANAGRFAALSCVFAAVAVCVCVWSALRHKGKVTKRIKTQRSYALQYLVTVSAIAVILNDIGGYFEYVFPLWVFLALEFVIMFFFCSLIILMDPTVEDARVKRTLERKKHARRKLMLADLRYIAGKYPANAEDIQKLEQALKNNPPNERPSHIDYEEKIHEAIRRLMDTEPGDTELFTRRCADIERMIEGAAGKA